MNAQPDNSREETYREARRYIVSYSLPCGPAKNIAYSCCRYGGSFFVI